MRLPFAGDGVGERIIAPAGREASLFADERSSLTAEIAEIAKDG